jgi:hypothetical protein
VKSNDLAAGPIKLRTFVNSFARLDSISGADKFGAVMVAANDDGFARMAVEGSRLAGGFLDSALAWTDGV